MARENMWDQKKTHIMVIGKTIKFTVLVNIPGIKRITHMKVNGKIMQHVDKDYLFGKMADNTKL